MCLKALRKIDILALFLLLSFSISSAQELLPFQGEINADNINVRSDATVSSEIICALKKDDRVEVVSLFYEWYKIRLPKSAPSFIKKNLVSNSDGKTAIVAKDNVNIRLGPEASCPIIGKANKNQIINIVADKGDWYKIEPINNSFGWIHKKFVKKIPAPESTQTIQLTEDKDSKNKEEVSDDLKQHIKIEGIVKPYGKVFKRTATHKLITEDGKTFLLKGNKENLNALNHHKIRVTGELINLPKQKHPIIEVLKLEALD